MLVGSRSVGRPRERWIEAVKECLRKGDLDVRQVKRVVQDRSELGGLWGGGMNPRT